MSAEQTISAPKLIVRDLNFYYGADRALKDINLIVPEKMVTAFIGPSGCGKSTISIFSRGGPNHRLTKSLAFEAADANSVAAALCAGR